MRVYLASDHAGFELKAAIAAFLTEHNYAVEDLGPHTHDPQDDYPDYCRPCAEKVAADKGSRGVVIGFSGQGEAMAANRVAGARAAVYYGGSEEVVRLSREHNDANILSLGAKFLSVEEAQHAVLLWITTEFHGDERHVRRIAKLDHD